MGKHENIAQALAAFQAELPKLRKDETAKVRGESQDGRPVNYSYGYADLAQVTEVVSPALGKHGLSFTSTPTMHPTGGFGLMYTLLHESGERIDGVWPLPNPMQVKPQALGSAITYARRYALMAVTNTFPDKEDDDGAGAVPAGHQDRAMSREQFDNLPKDRPAPGRRPSGRSQPAGDPAADKPRTWTDDEVADQIAKLTQLDLDKAGQLYDWMAGRDLHTRRVGVARDEDDVFMTATEALALRLADSALEPSNLPPDEEIGELDKLRDFADGRGLLKVQVSATETLDQVLVDARSLVNAQRLDTDHARNLQDQAAESWSDTTNAAS